MPPDKSIQNILDWLGEGPGPELIFTIRGLLLSFHPEALPNEGARLDLSNAQFYLRDLEERLRAAQADEAPCLPQGRQP